MRTDLDVPDSAGEVILVIGAPGRTLHAFGLPAATDPWTIDIAPRGGELHLRWPPATNPLRVLFSDRMIPVTDLWEWARALGRRVEGDSIAVPDVAAGKYQFCGGGRCVEGMLAIGGRLELDLTRAMAP